MRVRMRVHMYVCSKLTNERESVRENDEGDRDGAIEYSCIRNRNTYI